MEQSTLNFHYQVSGSTAWASVLHSHLYLRLGRSGGHSRVHSTSRIQRQITLASAPNRGQHCYHHRRTVVVVALGLTVHPHRRRRCHRFWHFEAPWHRRAIHYNAHCKAQSSTAAAFARVLTGCYDRSTESAGVFMAIVGIDARSLDICPHRPYRLTYSVDVAVYQQRPSKPGLGKTECWLISMAREIWDANKANRKEWLPRS